MDDGEIKFKTKIDNSNLDKGLNELKQKTTSASKTMDASAKSTNKLNDALKGTKLSAVAAGGAIAAGAVALKKTVDVLNDCAAAYRVQENAEKALAIAAKNNPYLNSENVANLKNFASALQSASEIGDEVSLQIMGELAAAGRSEREIMDIMQAAADMAAATGQDIGNVAQQLNATLNGNIGTLGRQLESVKNLTAEELKAGGAIKAVQQAYKGTAAELADTEVQLSNAWGDFKENIGKGWQEATHPVKKFFLDTLDQINEAMSASAENKDRQKAINNNTATLEQYAEQLKIERQKLGEIRTGIQDATRILNDKSLLEQEVENNLTTLEYETEKYNKALSTFKEREFAQRSYVDSLQARYNALKKVEEAEAAANKQAAEAAQREKEKADRDAAALQLITDNKAALEKTLDTMRLRAELTGDAVDQQEIYNAYLNSYIDLVTKDTSLVTENNSAAKERLKLLQQEAEKLKEIKDAEEAKAQAQKIIDTGAAVIDELNGSDNSYLEKYKQQQEAINAYKEELRKKDKDADEKYREEFLAADEALVQARKNLWRDMTEEINGYTQQVADLAQEAADLMLEAVDKETSEEMKILEDKYQRGEVDETEYYDEVKKIKRKAANEEYKIKMFQWQASLATAVANIAEGVSKAIAQGGVAGIVTGAIVGAAGAIQIASIMNSRPTPPHFAQGGYIGGPNGVTMGSDNTLIYGRNGELVLNAVQQRKMWDMLNNGPAAAGGLNVTVNNTQAQTVSTAVSEVDGGLVIDIIDAHINEGLSRGMYDNGLAGYANRQNGVTIL